MPTPLQQREVFHLGFLRAFTRAAPMGAFALKGGSNLRFFFGSARYSEDVDLDIAGVPVHVVREKVMSVLAAAGLADTLRTFGIERIVPPTIARAKQTETVQRFKVHLIDSAGQDLPTKVEFSRRGLDAPVRAESVSSSVLSAYRMPPLIVPHYTAEAALRQKVRALVGRRQPEPRDVFDLYTLGTQLRPEHRDVLQGLAPADLKAARERVFSIQYEHYRDAVVSFLGPDDQAAHDSEQIWDEIRLRALALLERDAGDEG